MLQRIILSVGMAALLGLGIIGCKDAAEPDFTRCQELERQGKLDDALKACQAAQAADKSSKYGSMASQKESTILDRLRQKKDEEASKANDQKDYDKVQDAESKVQWVLESTPQKDKGSMSEQCMARDRAFENGYSCGPKDPSKVPPGDGIPFGEECQVLAASRGCKPFTPNAPSKYYCCTK